MDETVDFVVIGSGIAGLIGALTLASYGNVLIITKRTIRDGATQYAQGGIACVTDKKDSFELHIHDTLKTGCYHNNRKAVAFLVAGGPQAVQRLVSFGVPFDRKQNGSFATSFEGAHSYPRILHATDFTGREIEKSLIANVAAHPNITVWENTLAADLIVLDNQCFGVCVIKAKSFISVFSKAMIITTGGAGQLYKWTTNPSVATGDGIAMAYRAGAKISDMEFIQFHPTALKEKTSPLFLLSEALRGEGAVLRDKTGKRFMTSVHPQAELAPRDVVVQAIFRKQREGDVCLDMRHKRKTFLTQRFPNISQALQKRGFDLSRDLIPVTPAAHFLCGGIVTDMYGRTSVKNLFAYGEVANTGVHGANRLASNSLLEGVVFASQIARCVGEFPKKVRIVPLPQLQYNKDLVGDNTYLIKQIQQIMWEYVGIVRSHQGLTFAMTKLKNLSEEIASIKQLNETSLEMKNMIQVALLITHAAYRRRKSLGTHYIEA